MTHQSFLEDVMQDIGRVETLEQAIIAFTKVGMPARDLSARTRIEYTHDLTDMAEFLAKRGKTNPSQIGLSDLEAYLAEMDHRGWKGSTRKRKTYAIKTFFTFLQRHAVVTQNVAERLLAPQPARKEARFLSEDEYQRLLRACSHNSRDSAIIELLLQTGMRLSELARLTIHDIELPRRITRDPDNTGSVRVRRKGGKIDTIPLNYKACHAIAAYLKVRPTVEHMSLFITKFKTPMSKRAIQQTVATYLRDANIHNASVHTLRHTMATHHIARGTDLKTIQETLGHASLATTSIYVSLAKQAQKKALQEHAL